MQMLCLKVDELGYVDSTVIGLCCYGGPAYCGKTKEKITETIFTAHHFLQTRYRKEDKGHCC